MKPVVICLTLLLSPTIYGQSFAVTTVAGTTHFRDGAAATSMPFRAPQGLASDPGGGFYFSDVDDFRVFKVSATGFVTLIAGTGQQGYSGDSEDAKSATFRNPGALVLDKKGNLYLSDFAVIRKIVLSSGIVTTFAGNGKITYSGDGGPALKAGMFPASLAVDPSGQYLYLADPVNSRIRRIDLTTNVITTVAGNGTTAFSKDDSPAATSSVLGPTGLSFDSQGNLAFIEGPRVKQIKSGIISTLAGTSKFDFGPVNTKATLSDLPGPFSTTYDSQDNLYIASTYDVRMVSAATGRVTKLAGGTTFGLVDGTGSQALFSGLGAIAITPTGDVLVTDPFNKAVRRISNVGAGASVSTVAGTDVKDGGAAPATFLDRPDGVAADFAGNVFIADTNDSRIRSVAVNGFIGTTIGAALAPSGPQNDGAVRLPHGVGADAQGAIFVADTGNQRIFRQRPGVAPEVVAGGNGAGYFGDGGPALSARLASPWNVTVDARGNLFIADYGNFRIRKVDAATHTISTVAGNGSATFSGDGAAATAAGCDCRAVAVDNGGNLYLADTANNRIRFVDAGNGIISTIVGGNTQGYSGDGGPAASARLFAPTGVAIDNALNLYIADSGNSVVRMVTRDGIIRTVAGTLQSSFSAESGQALAVNIDPRSVAIAPDGSVLVSDPGNDRVRRLTRQKVVAFTLPQATQIAAPGARATLAVRVVDANGIPVVNVPVSFTISSGPATLSASSAITGPDGIASVALTVGSGSGEIVVNASVPDLEQQQFRITVAAPSAQETLAPKIDAGGIAGAGLSVPPVKVLVPLGLATIFGHSFAPAGTAKVLSGADVVDGRVPTQLAGVCVTVGTTRAPITTVLPTQVTFQVPLLPAGPVSVRVITGCGAPNEITSDPEPSRVQAAAPEFFFFVNNADGKNPIAAIDAVTGGYLGKPGLLAGANFTAARIGRVISLFANYLGETTTGLQAGAIPQGQNSVQQTVQVEVGGHVIPAANILYAGAAPSSPGQYQINLILDALTPVGDQGVTVTAGGVSSPVGAYLTVAP